MLESVKLWTYTFPVRQLNGFIGVLLSIFTICTFEKATAGPPLLLEQSTSPLQAEAASDALTPWETPIEGFFIRSHHGIPSIPSPPDLWTVSIDGLVDHPLQLTLKELKKLPNQKIYAVLECSGNGRGQQTPSAPGVQWQRGAVGNAQWTGVSLSALLQKAGVQKNARFIEVEGADLPSFPSVPKFIRSIALEKANQADSLLVWEMNRVPLPAFHGGPLRLILPGWYGENWTKWIRRITLTDHENTDFYMKKGYRVPKTPVQPGQPWDSATGVAIERLKVQSFITTPKVGQTLAPGVVQVSGKAFSGERSISKVELSLDEGKTWKAAQVSPPRKEGGWQEFSAETDALAPGSWKVIARATDSSGETQPLTHEWNPGGYVRNSVEAVSFYTQSGQELFLQKCQSCHAKTLVERQTLTPQQWAGVIKKMEGFGVQVSEDEKKLLLPYLQTLSARTASEPTMISYETKNAALKETEHHPIRMKKGKDLFVQNCAICHGPQGEGKVGPRLGGRQIPLKDFISTVENGRGTMPPFREILKRDQILNLRDFVSTIGAK